MWDEDEELPELPPQAASASAETTPKVGSIRVRGVMSMQTPVAPRFFPVACADR